MGGEGFEPSKAEPTVLQTVPFGRSGIPPGVEPEDGSQVRFPPTSRLARQFSQGGVT